VRVENDDATARAQAPGDLLGHPIEVGRVAQGLDREDDVEGAQIIRQRFETGLAERGIGQVACLRRGAGDVLGHEVDADEFHAGVPGGEVERVGAKAAAEFEDALARRVGQAVTNFGRLRKESLLVAVAVVVQRNVHALPAVVDLGISRQRLAIILIDKLTARIGENPIDPEDAFNEVERIVQGPLSLKGGHVQRLRKVSCRCVHIETHDS